MARTIFHLDMDAFFANVERVLNPKLKGKPLIVGGNPEGRGVVSSASYEARKYGVHSAMPMSRAKKLCPHAVIVTPRHGRYGEFSGRIYRILQAYAPLVERASIDEFYLDLTGCGRLYGDMLGLAGKLKEVILRETGLPCSIGIASNKLVAKIASGQAKPDGLLRIPPGEESLFLSRLPVKELPGIGKSTHKKLGDMGIRTIGDLARFPRDLLVSSFGKVGESLWERARGMDREEVRERGRQKSLSQETTFESDSDDPVFLKTTLSHLVEEVGYRLRKQGMKAKTVTLKVRYSDFKTITRSRTVGEVDGNAEIYRIARELLEKAHTRRVRIRLLGVCLSNLTPAVAQKQLFEDEREKRKSSLYRSLDRIRDKFGLKLHFGSSIWRR